MTPGACGETADGMSLGKIGRIIDALRHECYRFSPVKRVYIPKKSGRLRPLGLPPWSSKLVGEVVRLLLEAYHEPQFSDRSPGDAGTYIKPMLVQAAWSAIRVRGRLQARYNRLVRRFGGDKNPAAKKAITAIAHTLLKIAYQVLKSGTPYQDLGADFYTRRESPSRSRPGWNARCRSSTPAAPLPSPSAPRRPP